VESKHKGRRVIMKKLKKVGGVWVGGGG